MFHEAGARCLRIRPALGDIPAGHTRRAGRLHPYGSTTQHAGAALDVAGARAYQAARAGVEWGLFHSLRNGNCGDATLNFSGTTLQAVLGRRPLHILQRHRACQHRHHRSDHGDRLQSGPLPQFRAGHVLRRTASHGFCRASLIPMRNSSPPQFVDLAAGVAGKGNGLRAAACRGLTIVLWTLLVAAPVSQAAWFDTNWKYPVAIDVPAAASISSRSSSTRILRRCSRHSARAEASMPTRRALCAPTTHWRLHRSFGFIYAGTTDAVGDSRGELRFILRIRGRPPTTCISMSPRAASRRPPRPEIDGNFERAAAGTQSPAGWTATRGNNNVNIQVRPSENPSVAADFGTPATTVTDRRLPRLFLPDGGADQQRQHCRAPSPRSRAASQSRRPIPAIWWCATARRVGTLTTVRAVRLPTDRLVGGPTTEIVGPTAGNYYAFPFSPDKRAAQFTNAQPGYGRYNFWTSTAVATRCRGMATLRLPTLVSPAASALRDSPGRQSHWSSSPATSPGTRPGSTSTTSNGAWCKRPWGRRKCKARCRAASMPTKRRPLQARVLGVIEAEITGSAFNLDVVALNMAKTAIEPTFVGSVKVELLDAWDQQRALDANGCVRAGT